MAHHVSSRWDGGSIVDIDRDIIHDDGGRDDDSDDNIVISWILHWSPSSVVRYIDNIELMSLISSSYMQLFLFSQSNASTGAGINDGIEWLCENIGNRHK